MGLAPTTTKFQGPSHDRNLPLGYNICRSCFLLTSSVEKQQTRAARRTTKHCCTCPCVQVLLQSTGYCFSSFFPWQLVFTYFSGCQLYCLLHYATRGLLLIYVDYMYRMMEELERVPRDTGSGSVNDDKLSVVCVCM